MNVAPYVDDPDFQLHVGSATDVLRTLPDESVHCVVTSPPYWGLRDYGTGTWEGGEPDCQHRVGGQVQDTKAKGAITAGVRPGVDASICLDCGARRIDEQLGLEPTPEAYVARMVEVFREVRRVLRRDGTCWLNLGDSYNSGTQFNHGKSTGLGTADRYSEAKETWGGHRSLLKPKDLVGIPWKVAFALQADGWYLRSDIIWAKPNPMPESVTDRPTKSHEYLFLLTREARYFYDADAIREPHSPDGRLKTVHDHQTDDSHPNYDNIGNGHERWPNGGRNARSVWEIATQPYGGAHFATFPEELPRRCIAAGTSERGCCPECGAPWERETGRACSECNSLVPTQAKECPSCGFRNTDWRATRVVNEVKRADDFSLPGNRVPTRSDLTPKNQVGGWRPTCKCTEPASAGIPDEPCVVLDPFMGSGTVALVARKLGRRSVGIELNPEYAGLAARRLQQQSLFA